VIRLPDFRRIVFFTGAGLSAESGIPTYRGKGGLWAKYDYEDYACQSAFDRDPAKVWDFHDERRRRIGACEPNEGHRIIAAVPGATVVTQNIDGLHQRAGSKGVLELQRILGSEDQILEVGIGSNHVRVQIGDIRFTSKLIDGRFPEYSRVIPSNPGFSVVAGREELRQALQRAAILSNEKYRGIRFAVKPAVLVIQSHNPEQEEAEEQLEVVYDGPELDIGFNVNYLLDALAAIEGPEVEIGLTDGNSSCLIHSSADAGARFVVMPMRL